MWISLGERSFWDIAVIKLLRYNRFLRGEHGPSFDVLGFRLALRHNPTQGYDQIQWSYQPPCPSTAIDQHMLILAGVTNKAVLDTRFPPEPVLAVAASLVMLPTKKAIASNKEIGDSWQIARNRYGSILETVEEYCFGAFKGFDIRIGTRGEMVVRLLLMTAWDAIKRTTWHGEEERKYPPEYANHLMAPEALEDIFQDWLSSAKRT